MLGPQSGRKVETLRLGRDRLRLRPWAGEVDTGQLVLLTPGTAVDDAAAARAVETAAVRGYRRLRTSALSGFESEPFIRAGFKPCQQLALLTRSIQDKIPAQSGGIAIRRARRRDHRSALAVDHEAFDLFWQLDKTGLRDALRATPYRYFRVADQQGRSALAGYAICGLSGPVGYLQRLAVSPRQQGQGAGAALARDGLAWMAHRGATQAWVNTPQHNSGALRLYERLGFELVPPGLQVLELILA